jgi:glycosyltransferase involved in cell wall biosynthesis
MPVSMTDEHPVLCYKRNNNKSTNLPEVADIQPEWLPVSDIGKYDLLCYPVPKERDPSDLKFWDISPSFARFLGYYAAEGCMMYEGIKENNHLKGVQLTFGAHETNYVEDVCNIVRGEYDLEPTVRYDDTNNTLVVRIFNREFAEDVSCYIDGTAPSKSFEGNIIHARRSIIACILCGLLRGDGCINNERGSYCTSSKTLAHQVFNMMIALGIMPSYNLNENRLDDKIFQRYIFSVRAESLKAFREVYERGVVPIIRDTKRISDDYAFLTVKSVDVSPYNDVVFNFEVEEDNSYITSFAVHNCEFQERSVFRPWFKWVLMPTVDAEPQLEDWIQTYENANLVLAYSDYGIHTLRNQTVPLPGGRFKMKIWPHAMRPGVDLKTFHPMDKMEVRDEWNIKRDLPIIGTVMRNQSRKLYPDLIDAFALMKNKYAGEPGVDESVLLIHSGWPDNVHSFDYPRHIMRLDSMPSLQYHHKGIRGSVLQSLHCHSCGEPSWAYAMNLHGRPVQEGRIKMPCSLCGKVDASPPATAGGFDREQLAKFYNLMDVYVQCSICEGDGMPIQEAKACGVPTLVTDYTAMREKGRYPNYSHFEELGYTEDSYTCHLGGEVIDVERYYHEPETSCMRAHPSREDLAEKLKNMLADRERLGEMSRQARKCAEDNYDWDKLIKNWETVLDGIKIMDRSKTWDSPIEIHDTIKSLPAPEGLSNEQYVEWLYLNILKYPAVDTAGAKVWVEHLERGITREALMEQFVSIGNQQSDASKVREQIRAQLAGQSVGVQQQQRTQEFV